MQVNITETKYKSLPLDTGEQERIVIKTLEEIYKVQGGDWIENGKLMREVEYHGSHSWYSNEVIRDSVKKDKEGLKVLKAVRKHFKD